MSKIIRLTELDLNKIVRRVIKEQSLKENKLMTEQNWLKKLFGTSVDDLIRLFGDDAVKSFETVLIKALQNSKNFVGKGGQNYLKSARGTETSMDAIQQAIKLVTSGARSVDEVATLLPRQLADGSEFREVFKKSFSKKPVAPTKPVVPKTPAPRTDGFKSDQERQMFMRQQGSQVNSRYGAGSN